METQARHFWNNEFFDTFKKIAYRFGEEPSAPYPFYEIRRNHILNWLDELTPGHVLDVGCGGGHVLQALLERGWSGEACDFASNMVSFARQRLNGAGYGTITVQELCATDLTAYAEKTFDTVLCLGPIEYLDEDEATRAYRQMHRVLKPGGRLVCAHINQLFDLFTCDGFTAQFIGQQLVDSYGLDQDQRAGVDKALRERFSSTDTGVSIRNKVKTRPDNPLTLANELDAIGFSLSDLRFYRFYSLPPAVARAMGVSDADAIEHEERLAAGWPGHLLASSFLSLSVKTCS